MASVPRPRRRELVQTLMHCFEKRVSILIGQHAAGTNPVPESRHILSYHAPDYLLVFRQLVDGKAVQKPMGRCKKHGDLFRNREQVVFGLLEGFANTAAANWGLMRSKK